jgi:hypothetical protein
VPAATAEIMRHVLGAGLSPVVYSAGGFDPDAAAGRGLVDIVCSPGDLIPTAVSCAAELSSGVAITFAEIKAALRAPAIEAIRTRGGDAARMADLWTRDDVLAAAEQILTKAPATGPRTSA